MPSQPPSQPQQQQAQQQQAQQYYRGQVAQPGQAQQYAAHAVKRETAAQQGQAQPRQMAAQYVMSRQPGVNQRVAPMPAPPQMTQMPQNQQQQLYLEYEGILRSQRILLGMFQRAQRRLPSSERDTVELMSMILAEAYSLSIDQWAGRLGLDSNSMMLYCERTQDMYRAILAKRPGDMEGMLQDAWYDFCGSLDRYAATPDAFLSNVVRLQSVAPKESSIPTNINDFS